MVPELKQTVSTSLAVSEDKSTKMNEVETGEKSSTIGYHLRWSRLMKKVQVAESGGGLLGRSSVSRSFRSKGQGESSEKIILNKVSASAAPGTVMAILGPSGSGKTTLLNTLSGRSSYQEGTISINGVVANPTRMKRLMAQVGYVRQQDIFFGHLSVRDQLSYTALLRLSAALPKAAKIAEVEKMLTLLRLANVADSPIRMLSGGEKKRVNIGTELLTDPPVLLLDEPTSGLDITNAVSLLKLLRRVAVEQSKTVVTSIHQPSSAVFSGFDNVLILAQGRVVYYGSPRESLSYLRDHALACPDGYNAADHWMDLLVLESNETEDDEEVAQLIVSPRQRLQESWDNEAIAREIDTSLVRDDDDVSESGIIENSCKYSTTWSTQYYYLTHRALKNSRSAIFTPLNLTKSVAIGVIAGLLWYQREYTESSVNDIRSYYFFTMTFWVFDSMFQALAAFPDEREVILKERSSASYRLSAYFLAKTTSDAPVRLILPFLYMIISFWMAGISSDFAVFLGTVGCTLLSVLSGESIGLFVGAAIYDLQMALTVMTVCTLALMLLGGFFVENVPEFISWGKFLSPFKYAFDSSLQLVFTKPIPCDGSGDLENLCLNSTEVSVEDLREFVGIQGTIGFNVGMLFVICIVLRYGAYVALRQKKDGER